MVYKFEIKQAYCPIYYSCSNVEEHVLTVWLFWAFYCGENKMHGLRGLAPMFIEEGGNVDIWCDVELTVTREHNIVALIV
jgi:hypothetical protein